MELVEHRYGGQILSGSLRPFDRLVGKLRSLFSVEKDDADYEAR